MEETYANKLFEVMGLVLPTISSEVYVREVCKSLHYFGTVGYTTLGDSKDKKEFKFAAIKK